MKRLTWSIFVFLGFWALASAADPPYFPPRAFVLNSGGDISGMLDDSFSEALRRMNEPSLWAASRTDPSLTAYRVLLLPSEGQPIAVRVEKSDERISYRLATLDGNGGYDMGKLARDQREASGADRWDRLAGEVEATRFWDLPNRIDRIGADGTDWLIEGVREGKYHVVDRWTPEPGAFLDLGQTLLDLMAADSKPQARPAEPSTTDPMAADSKPQARPAAPALSIFVEVATTHLPASLLILLFILFLRRWNDDDPVRKPSRPPEIDELPCSPSSISSAGPCNRSPSVPPRHS